MITTRTRNEMTKDETNEVEDELTGKEIVGLFALVVLFFSVCGLAIIGAVEVARGWSW